MTAQAFLADLAARDIRLSMVNNRLRVNAPRGTLTAELHQTLSDHKAELLKALRQRTPGQYLADLSLHFADHPDHHVALDRFCELADEYHRKHGLSTRVGPSDRNRVGRRKRVDSRRTERSRAGLNACKSGELHTREQHDAPTAGKACIGKYDTGSTQNS